MSDCKHPIAGLVDMGGDAWDDKLLRCSCSAQLLMNSDIIRFDEPGFAKRIILFAKHQLPGADPFFNIEDLHSPQSAKLIKFPKAA